MKGYFFQERSFSYQYLTILPYLMYVCTYKLLLCRTMFCAGCLLCKALNVISYCKKSITQNVFFRHILLYLTNTKWNLFLQKIFGIFVAYGPDCLCLLRKIAACYFLLVIYSLLFLDNYLL